MNHLFKMPVFVFIITGFTACNSCKKDPPIVTTTKISDVKQTSAVSGGNVTNNGGEDVTARGVCWGTAQGPTTDLPNKKTTDGNGNGPFISTIEGLTVNTTYHVRAYATNSEGTGYGSDISFITTVLGMTDIEGNVYKTVVIGGQVWMAENLKTTKYRNGDPIPNLTDLTQWASLSTGAYCWYNNDASSYKDSYGALYNWHTIGDSRNLCPAGWHIPTDEEWTTLINYLGGPDVAAGKLKETGSAHWHSPNEDATNISGFTALPAGELLINTPSPTTFTSLGDQAIWWSATELSGTYASELYINYYPGRMWPGAYSYKEGGFSIRCLKD